MRLHISASLRREIVERAGHRCEYCRVHEDDFYLSGEIDHIRSLRHGGSSDAENLAYSCVHCNRNKGYNEAIILKGKPVRLFNPRTDIWNEYFELSGIVILSKTEIAEATIQVLKINSEERLRERAVFALEGTYP
ncbi:MAG: HNH endonuclease [Saprospiraceae bacterium]